MKLKSLSVSLIFVFLISLPTFTSAATPDEGLIDNFDNDASLASAPGERDGEWYDEGAHNLNISGSVGNAYMRFDASQLAYFGIRGLDATGKKTDFSNATALTFYLSISLNQYSHYPEPMTYYFSIYMRLIDTDGNATNFNYGAYIKFSGIGATAGWTGTVRIPIYWGNVDRSHIEQIQFRVSPPPNYLTYCTFDNLRAEEQATSTPTFTITPTPMNTPEDTATYTVTPTYTTTPEDTVTITPTPTPTPTPVSTAVPTSMPVYTATYTATSSTTVAPTVMVPTSTHTVISTATSTMFVEAQTVWAYPNPARGQVNFAYTVSGAVKITIDIYQLTGERVARIVEHKHGGGQTLVTSWQAAGVVPGVYLARIVITDASGKVMLSKQKKVALIM